jgi:hypothetical protein
MRIEAGAGLIPAPRDKKIAVKPEDRRFGIWRLGYGVWKTAQQN